MEQFVQFRAAVQHTLFDSEETLPRFIQTPPIPLKPSRKIETLKS